MWFVCLDLESVLIPELWPALAEAFDVEELTLTTRQVASKKELNAVRLAALKKHKITLAQIEKVIARVKPLPGAVEFIEWLRPTVPFLIVSDCFRPLALPVLKKLGTPTVIAHDWKTKAGRITSLPLRLEGDTKAPVVRALQGVGYKVFASGDSLNDLGMLKQADASAWFCPSPRALAQAPKLPVCESYGALKKKILALK